MTQRRSLNGPPNDSPAGWYKDWLLTPHLTLGVTSVADFGCVVRTEAELKAAVQAARAQGLEYRVLGGGSNIIAEPRIPGLVIQLALRGVAVTQTKRAVRLRAAAGESWHGLVRRCLGLGLQGVETLALIPGSVGAAPIQNIGAYGGEFSEVCARVRVYQPATNQIEEIPGTECDFAYRSSRFKTDRGREDIVLAAELELPRWNGERLPVRYQDVQDELARMGRLVSPEPTTIAEAVCRIRRRKLPDWRRFGNVGSVFKNPTVSAEAAHKLQQQEPLLRTFPQRRGVRLAAGQLVELCGYRGEWFGHAGVWHRQALVLIQQRRDSAGRPLSEPASDFLALAANIQDKVAERFGLQLEVEPVLWGALASR